MNQFNCSVISALASIIKQVANFDQFESPELWIDRRLKITGRLGQ